MAAEKGKKRRIRKPETVREKAQKASGEKPTKRRRLRKTVNTAAKPLSAVKRIGKKEYHPIKLPDNKVGRFLTKRRSFIPKYFRNAWKELRQVTWPGRRETIQLTIAVFIFAVVFGALIAVTDYGLDKLFRRILT